MDRRGLIRPFARIVLPGEGLVEPRLARLLPLVRRSALLGMLLKMTACSSGSGAGPCAPGPCVCEATARFAFVGSMSVSRTAHTATLLRDGRVFVAGGEDSVGPGLPEAFDPKANTFASGTNEPFDPYLQAAVALQDGRVYLLGLGDRSADIYDPTKRAFTPAHLPLTAANDRSAVLLPDGNVLITGGWQCGNTDCTQRPDIADAELYDPSQDRLAAAGVMTCPRSGHTATLLRNGTVLLVGGLGCPTADLYDPSTGAFKRTGNMVKARSGHTATLLPDGSVLVAGGKTPDSDQFYGDTTAELYDPSAGGFSQTGSMAPPRTGHTATLLADGKVLMVGGIRQDAETNQLYDPATRTFAATARLQWQRLGHTATLLRDGRVLIAGGVTNLAEVYIPACD